jgi:hypothetical protein
VNGSRADASAVLDYALARSSGGEHNGAVRHRSLSIHINARLMVLIAALAISALADLRSSATAMACCARTHNRCAGVRQADDCCKRMGHGTAFSVAGTLAAVPASVLPAAIAVDFLHVTLPARHAPAADLAFARPHDPPHLHPFSLLI